MERVAGRSDDMMIVRGVNVFPTQVEEQILAIGELAPQFVCVLTRPGRLDELTVRVESRTPLTLAERERVAHQLASRVKRTVGVSIGVDVVEPFVLERSLGKAKRIEDLRPRG